MARVRFGVWVAALGLLGCDADARIHLLQRAETLPLPGMDAGGTPYDPQPSAGADARDAGPPPRPMPGPDPMARRDSGPPPVANPGTAGSRPPAPEIDSLVLRYDFSGSGDVVRDLVGDNHARLMGGTTLSPDRTYIRLDGVDDYVDIPNGLISGLHSATFIAWVAWNGGPCWQRVFDFGISDRGEGEVGEGVTSLFMTPRACGDEAFVAMGVVADTQYPVVAERVLPAGYALQVALVVDGDSRTLSLYRDTEKVGEAAMPFQLDQLTDANNWIGRSQWTRDAFFAGSIGEFRIYSRALSAEEIVQVRAEGFPTP